MPSFKIEGGVPLNGTISPMPNKNSIVALIPACVLADTPITIHNVPKSSSVRVMLNIFKELGGKVSYFKKDSVTLNPTTINKYTISDEFANKERASLMFIGPLLARFGKAIIGGSGGCTLGNRPLDALFQGLRALGATIESKNGYTVKTKKLLGNGNIWLVEASVTGTENLILTAVKASGTTVIYNAACEPHVQDLCNFLVSLGAKIRGIGTNRIEITGVQRLKGGTWSVIPDHVDIGGLIAAAVITGGELRIKNAIPEHMTQILNYYRKLNVKVAVDKDDIIIPKNQNLVCKRNEKGNVDKVMDQPWPGFPVDLIPQAVVLATKAKGSIRIYGIMYETQLLFVQELLKMNAEIVLANSHEVITFGPSKLKGSQFVAPTILQAAHAMVLAALAAEGTTVIQNTDIISRRYPDLVSRLSKLGAKISKVR